MNKKEIRKVLNIPEELRIWQHLHNEMQNAGYGNTVNINGFQDGKVTDISYDGIDAFYVGDDELLSILNKE